MTEYHEPMDTPAAESIVPDLPQTVVTRNGQVIDLTGDIWRMTQESGMTKESINWGNLRAVKIDGTCLPVLSQKTIHLSQLYIANKMPYIRVRTATKIYDALMRLARWLKSQPQWLPAGRSFESADLTEAMFDAWLTDEYKTGARGKNAAHVRAFYRWGSDPDEPYPGFSIRISQALDNVRLRSPPRGEVIARRDPHRGPFSREEMLLILEACESGKGSDQDRAITWVFQNTGIRPEQLTLLRNSDLQAFEMAVDTDTTEDVSSYSYQLRIRKTKRKYDEPEYQFLPLSSSCGLLLSQLRRPDSDINEPLFWWIRKAPRHHIMKSLRSFFQAADLRSPRLPLANPDPAGPYYERLPVTPRRFRYGIATDRAAQGDSPENIKDFLGHSNVSTTYIYIETSPLIADEFQKATDHAIVPLVRRMRGRLDDERNPSNAPVIPAVVPQVSPNRQLRVIGTIGKCDAGGHCNLNPVTSCFGCENFIARPDAPLTELRDMILDDIKSDLAEVSSPAVVTQLKDAVREINEWIEHIERAKHRAAVVNQF